MRLVVFDLDGTITYRDTLLPYVSGYLARAHRSRARMLGVLPTLGAFACGAADHGAVKSAFIKSTLGGASRADLAQWTRQPQGQAPDRALVCQTLQDWQHDPDLAALRDAPALARITAAEQEKWRNLWADVDKALATLRPAPSNLPNKDH